MTVIYAERYFEKDYPMFFTLGAYYDAAYGEFGEDENRIICPENA